MEDLARKTLEKIKIIEEDVKEDCHAASVVKEEKKLLLISRHLFN